MEDHFETGTLGHRFLGYISGARGRRTALAAAAGPRTTR